MKEMNRLYSEKAKEHFRNPQNAYRMQDADAESSIGEPWCGDSLRMYIKVKDNIIEEISYVVFACSAAIATSSVTSMLAKGRTLEEASKITDQDIIEALGGLPEEKKDCSNLVASALRMVIQNYKDKAS